MKWETIDWPKDTPIEFPLDLLNYINKNKMIYMAGKENLKLNKFSLVHAVRENEQALGILS